MKRFQECNWLEKLWRYRWYVPIPFIWVRYELGGGFKVGIDEYIDGEYTHTEKVDTVRGKNLWKLLVGIAQTNMRYVYTNEEVMDEIFKNRK